MSSERTTMKTTSDETLAAIEEAGKRATERPWQACFGTLAIGIYRAEADGAFVLSGPESTWGQRAADTRYTELAANHADTIAAELRELRAKMERVREILGKQVDDHGTYVPSSDTEARELVELLKH